MIQAGKLRHRVAIQAATDTRNANGEMVQTWTTITDGTVWAAVEPLSSAERMTADQPQAELTHRVTIRYNAVITHAHRLLFGTRVLNIASIRDLDEHGRQQELSCIEVAP